MISTFGLERRFLSKFSKLSADFGWKSGPNSVGEIVCARTYSRFLEETGRNEQWYEICARVVNGCYRMQEMHVRNLNIEWDEDQAQRSAQEMYARMFHMKFLPPGRGLWCMGTAVTEKRKIHAALMNCAFVGTTNLHVDKYQPFCFLMDASMLGVGVGFDTKGAGKLKIKGVKGSTVTYRIPDTREGWVESLKLLILSFTNGINPVEFIYSDIRVRGLPIRTFGGTSSGPECLIELHNKVRAILQSYVGLTLDTRSIVDIMNLIGVCVVAGNVRRTAEIAFGEPGDLVFSNLKNYEMFPERQAYGWTSNNSIFTNVGQSYDQYREPICANGEPGFAWLENMRAYGRMGDPADFKDIRVSGGNPCCTSDTRLLTRFGNIAIGTIENEQVDCWNGKEWSTVLVRKTGTNQVVNLVTLSDGTELKCTPYHNWVLRGNCRTRTFELRKGDQLEKFEMPVVEGTNVTTYDMYTHGFFCGAGQISENGSKGILLYGVNKNCQYRLEGQTTDNKLKSDHVWVSIQKDIPNKNYVPHLASIDNRLTWLSGLFDAIGHVHQNPNSTLIFLSGVDKFFLQEVRLLLTTLGVQAKINNQAEACYRLMLNASDMEKLLKLGLNTERLRVNRRYSNRDECDFVTVESVIQLEGLHDVYCATEPKNNTLTFEGIVTGQCLEQSLESYELCCLVETFVNRHRDLEDFKRTLKFAYLYAKTVTLGQTHWVDSNRVMLRNRRIGCSLSGIQQFITRHGMNEFRKFCDSGYQWIQNLDKQYSEWLCIPRSIKTTSIKPSGTVSLLTGSTPGMHWPVCNYHIRRVTLAKNAPIANALMRAGYHVEDAAYDPSSVIVEIPTEPETVVRDVSQVTMWEQLEMAAMLQEYWADNQVSCTVTFDPETEGKDLPRALDAYQYRLKGVSFLPQKKVPMDTDEAVKAVRASEKYKQMPYSPITQAEYLEKIKGVKRVDFKQLVSTEGGSDKFCSGEKCELPQRKEL